MNRANVEAQRRTSEGKGMNALAKLLIALGLTMAAIGVAMADGWRGVALTAIGFLVGFFIIGPVVNGVRK